jgi:hypothetical protein
MLKLTDRRIRQLADKLKAERFGGVWMFRRIEIEKYKKRKNGRKHG